MSNIPGSAVAAVTSDKRSSSLPKLLGVSCRKWVRHNLSGAPKWTKAKGTPSEAPCTRSLR
jgi:hypothetical protein